MGGWPPKKNTDFALYFPIWDADGDLVGGASGLDSEFSIDGGSFVDCNGEATEVAASSGMFKLALAASEMNGDVILVITKTSTTGAKTATNVLYTSTRQIDDSVWSSGSLKLNANNTVYADVRDWVGVSPSALSGGLVQTAVTSVAASAIQNTSFKDGAIHAGVVTASTLGVTAFSTGAYSAIADRIWRRSASEIETSAEGDALSFRSPYGAIAKMVNRIGFSGANFTVYKADDTASLGVQTASFSSTASPVTALDTA